MNHENRLIDILSESFEKQHAKRGLLTAQHTAQDLLANGVVVSPCKIDDMIYLFFPKAAGTYEAIVKEIRLFEESQFVVAEDLYFGRRQIVFFEQFGETAFLTKEKAEAKLKER